MKMSVKPGLHTSKDYKVKFLFSQMEHKIPDLDLTQTEVEDRKGWITDTFTFTGYFNQNGLSARPLLKMEARSLTITNSSLA